MITTRCVEYSLYRFSWNGKYCIEGARQVVCFMEWGIVELKVFFGATTILVHYVEIAP